MALQIYDLDKRVVDTSGVTTSHILDIDNVANIELKHIDFGEDIKDPNVMLDYLNQLLIRFENDPDYYTQKDYLFLIKTLTNSLPYIYTRLDADVPEATLNIKDSLNTYQELLDLPIKRVGGLYNIISPTYIYSDGSIHTTPDTDPRTHLGQYDADANFLYVDDKYPTFLDDGFDCLAGHNNLEKELAEIELTSDHITMDHDIQCNLPAGKTFGKYEAQDVIHCVGKTIQATMMDIASQILSPTLSLSGPSNYEHNLIGTYTPTLNFTYGTNNPGATVTDLTLVRSIDGNDTNIPITLGTNSIVDSIVLDPTNNILDIEYTMTCTDSINGIIIKHHTISNTAYSRPSSVQQVLYKEWGDASGTLNLVLSNMPDNTTASNFKFYIERNGNTTELYNGSSNIPIVITPTLTIDSVELRNIDDFYSFKCDVTIDNNGSIISRIESYTIATLNKVPHLLRGITSITPLSTPDYNTVRTYDNITSNPSVFDISFENRQTSFYFASNKTFTKAYNSVLPAANWNNDLTNLGEFQLTADENSILTYKLYKFQTGGSPSCIVRFE